MRLDPIRPGDLVECEINGSPPLEKQARASGERQRSH
jgi:hypothetical protein